MKFQAVLLASLAAVASAHFTFPVLEVDGEHTGEWQYIRKTNNFETGDPLYNVKSADIRCYNTVTQSTAETVDVSVDTSLSFHTNHHISHSAVASVYLAKAPRGVDVANWEGKGKVWFKVLEIPPVITNGTLSFPAEGMHAIDFDLPNTLPNGQYLARVEVIALHTAAEYGAAHFYVSCAQINVTGGGKALPPPHYKVAFPGAYTGYEPGILINITETHTSYKMPGPKVWQG